MFRRQFAPQKLLFEGPSSSVRLALLTQNCTDLIFGSQSWRGFVHTNYFWRTMHLKGKLQAELLQRRIYRHLAKSSFLGFVLGKFQNNVLFARFDGVK